MTEDMLGDQIPTSETTAKIGFDARLQYYDVLKKFMLQQKLSALVGDVHQWHRGLYILYNMTSAYISPKDRENIKRELLKVRSNLRVMRTTMNGQQARTLMQKTEKDLLEIEESIHMAAKSMFLPIREEQIGQFNDEDFLRGSDA